MSQPTPYTRQTDFSDDERLNVGGRSTVRTDRLDAELDALGTTANETAANLGLLQRDDGALRDRIVTPEALSLAVTLMIGGNGFQPRGTYSVGRSYVVKDLVEHDSGSYVCLQAIPVASDFNTERASGKWQSFASTVGQALSALSLPFGPVGGMSATNAQAAIIETRALAILAKTTADDALAAAQAGGGGTGTGTGTDTSITTPVLGLIAAAVAAANKVGSDVRDPTLPPAPVGFTAASGPMQAELSWTKAAYTVGHGPGRTIIYSAEWPDANTAPAVGVAVNLGGIEGVAQRANVISAAGKKLRYWISFESADGYEGPKSAPADVVIGTIPKDALGQLQIDARDIAASMAMGRLVNDPSFAAGASVWSGFVQRLAAGAAGAPAGMPVEYMAQFQGRDCLPNRSFPVKPGDVYRISAAVFNGATGLAVGTVVYAYNAAGGQLSATVIGQLTPAANTHAISSGTFTVPAGAASIKVGPHIEQLVTGTATCWFGDLRVSQMTDANLIVNGSVTAAALAVDTLTAIDARIGNANIAAAKITGQLTAAQIDTRDLAIKDSAGNVVFSAGTKLGTSYIVVGAVSDVNTTSSMNVSVPVQAGQSSRSMYVKIGTVPRPAANRAVISYDVLLTPSASGSQTTITDYMTTVGLYLAPADGRATAGLDAFATTFPTMFMKAFGPSKVGGGGGSRTVVVPAVAGSTANLDVWALIDFRAVDAAANSVTASANGSISLTAGVSATLINNKV